MGSLSFELSAKTPQWVWMDASGQQHTRADLTRIVTLHLQWLTTAGKDGARADFTGAKLRGADLHDVNLSGANLEGSDLTGANLDGAILGPGDHRPAPPSVISVKWQLSRDTPESTYWDLVKYFFKSIVTRRQEEHSCMTSFNALPQPTVFAKAQLVNAVLTNARLLGTDLSEANLTGANLSGAKLSRVDLRDAHLSGALLSGAWLIDSRLLGADLTAANLSSADLSRSDLRYAHLRDAKLDGADFSGAVVCQAEFEPLTISADPRLMATARGLEFLAYNDRPDALTVLRSQFKEKGFRAQERQLTYALRWHEDTEKWSNCYLGSSAACAEFFLSELFLNWTCGYGLVPGRALQLLVRLWILCTFVYWYFLRYSKHGGLYLVPSRLGGTILRHPRLQRLKPHSRRGRRTQHHRGLRARIKSFFGRKSLRRIKSCCPLLRAAAWFSTVSAFNIGFRDVAAGRWLRLLTAREYEIKARGFLRAVSGLQSLLSLGLLALWVLTYFGRPFE